MEQNTFIIKKSVQGSSLLAYNSSSDQLQAYYNSMKT